VPVVTQVLDVVDWRQLVFALYAEVRERAAADPRAAHAQWCARRDELFANHPASPLPSADRAHFTGLRVVPYDPAYRFELEIEPVDDHEPATPVVSLMSRATDSAGRAGAIPFALIGRVTLPDLGRLNVWSLQSYGGGIFLPVKDALAGTETYGGGRYVLDTAKGAYLGETPGRKLVVDLNFAFNPSCAYDPAWFCPLASAGNTVGVPLPVGELAPETDASRPHASVPSTA
jgi:uncharacterized protein (DUF1684 family)